MTRFSDDYEEQFPGQGELWEANLRRALSGKRGQAALRDLETALLEMPEKIIIRGKLADRRGHVCTVGLLALHRRVLAGEDREAVLADLAEPDYCECMHDHRDHVKATGRCLRCEAQAAEWHRKKLEGTLEPWQERYEPQPCQQFTLDEEMRDGDEDLGTALVGTKAGIAFCMAWHLGYLNDETWYGDTDEERYEHLLEWVRKRIIREEVAA